MSISAAKGYYVSGVNNVKVKLYPQVLGICKIHEHNLCNALRDFGLMIKSDSRRTLLNYNYEFLKFAHLMRSSEICMIAHGYSLLKLEDHNWWDSFTSISSKCLYDMDGKEIAGFLYSLTKVYEDKNHLISKLIDESKAWISLASPISLSLLVKVFNHFKTSPNYIKMLNQRALELLDELKIVDIVFFLTANHDSKNHDSNFFRSMCLRAIELVDEIELHHLRAIVASLSMAGFKSHIMFNILTMRLSQLRSKTSMNEGDVISILLAFTTQKFLVHNDLCIDSKVYKNFLKDHPTSGTDIFTFPLPEFGQVFSEALSENKERITATGMPIILRGISMLEIPLDPDTLDYFLSKTTKHLNLDFYRGLRLSNLVVTMVKFKGLNTEFWEAVKGTLERLDDPQLSGDMISKMINTISSSKREELLENKEMAEVYQTLVKRCASYAPTMSSKSILALLRHLLLTKRNEILTSDEFFTSVVNLVPQLPSADIAKVLRVYSSLEENVLPKSKLAELLEAVKRSGASEREGSKESVAEIMELTEKMTSDLNL